MRSFQAKTCIESEPTVKLPKLSIPFAIINGRTTVLIFITR